MGMEGGGEEGEEVENRQGGCCERVWRTLRFGGTSAPMLRVLIDERAASRCWRLQGGWGGAAQTGLCI
jgi:hypothetical protein